MQIASGVLERLQGARYVVVFTGAGVSAESGLATFRDALTGLWSKFDALALATPEAFERDPALVWGWYEWRRAKVARAGPNAAHRAIATLSGRVARLTVVTQNVDDLHERAGSAGVLHLHGRIDRPRCAGCGDAPATLPMLPPNAPDGASIEPPRCARCGGRLRPGVVWFGEALPREIWEEAQAAAQACDAFLCVGTSSVVEPAAGLTRIAIAAGAVTVQVNTDRTPLDEHVTLNLRGAAGQRLPELVSLVWPGAQ